MAAGVGVGGGGACGPKAGLGVARRDLLLSQWLAGAAGPSTGELSVKYSGILLECQLFGSWKFATIGVFTP